MTERNEILFQTNTFRVSMSWNPSDALYKDTDRMYISIDNVKMIFVTDLRRHVSWRTYAIPVDNMALKPWIKHDTIAKKELEEADILSIPDHKIAMLFLKQLGFKQ